MKRITASNERAATAACCVTAALQVAELQPVRNLTFLM
jgi:hypothetical protein